MSQGVDWNLAHREPWLIYFIFFMLIITPAAATTITADEVSAYSFVADSGQVIYQIVINEVPIGTNQSHVLVYNGQVFLLTINTYYTWGVWRNADISLTMPNGSTQSQHVDVIGPYSEYKTTIQPVFLQAYSLEKPFIAVSLNVGVTPTKARFTTQPQDMPGGWSAADALPFTAVSGTIDGGPTNVYIEEIPEKDFISKVTGHDLAYGIGNLGSQVFQWAWSSVLAFISMIPVIGPAMVSLIDAMSGIISTGVYWVIFVVSNFPAILGGVEVLIIMMAVINAGSGKNSFKKLTSNLFQYNKAFILGVIGLADIVWSWTRTAVEMVAAIIQALKP